MFLLCFFLIDIKTSDENSNEKEKESKTAFEVLKSQSENLGGDLQTRNVIKEDLSFIQHWKNFCDEYSSEITVKEQNLDELERDDSSSVEIRTPTQETGSSTMKSNFMSAEDFGIEEVSIEIHDDEDAMVEYAIQLSLQSQSETNEDHYEAIDDNLANIIEEQKKIEEKCTNKSELQKILEQDRWPTTSDSTKKELNINTFKVPKTKFSLNFAEKNSIKDLNCNDYEKITEISQNETLASEGRKRSSEISLDSLDAISTDQLEENNNSEEKPRRARRRRFRAEFLPESSFCDTSVRIAGPQVPPKPRLNVEKDPSPPYDFTRPPTPPLGPPKTPPKSHLDGEKDPEPFYDFTRPPTPPPKPPKVHSHEYQLNPPTLYSSYKFSQEYHQKDSKVQLALYYFISLYQMSSFVDKIDFFEKHPIIKHFSGLSGFAEVRTLKDILSENTLNLFEKYSGFVHMLPCEIFLYYLTKELAEVDPDCAHHVPFKFDAFRVDKCILCNNLIKPGKSKIVSKLIYEFEAKGLSLSEQITFEMIRNKKDFHINEKCPSLPGFEQILILNLPKILLVYVQPNQEESEIEPILSILQLKPIGQIFYLLKSQIFLFRGKYYVSYQKNDLWVAQTDNEHMEFELFNEFDCHFRFRRIIMCFYEQVAIDNKCHLLQ